MGKIWEFGGPDGFAGKSLRSTMEELESAS
jgi:hypothetical protein